MQSLRSSRSMHFVLKTPSSVLFDGLVDEVTGENSGGPFTLHHGEQALAALTPGTLVLRSSDGGTTRVHIDFGSLIADGTEVRASVHVGRMCA